MATQSSSTTSSSTQPNQSIILPPGRSTILPGGGGFTPPLGNPNPGGFVPNLGGGHGGGRVIPPAPVANEEPEVIAQPATQLPTPQQSASLIYAQQQAVSPNAANYVPVYSGGDLVGFQRGETFLPKEITLNRAGEFRPEQVKPIVSTNLKTGEKTTVGFQNPEGNETLRVTTVKGTLGNTSIPKTTTYYNTIDSSGNVISQATSTTTPSQSLQTQSIVPQRTATQPTNQRDYAAALYQERGKATIDLLRETGESYIKGLQYISDKITTRFGRPAFYAENDITPPTVQDVQTYLTLSGGVLAGGIGGVTALGADVFFGTVGAKTIAQAIKDPTARNQAAAALSVLPVLSLGIRGFNEARYRINEEPIKLVEKPSVEPLNVPTRQRATLFLEVIDNEGNVKGVVLGKNRFNEFISPGGNIETGETPRQAALREAGEELGIKETQIKDLTYLGRANPLGREETFQVFTGRISQQTFESLKPSSDIKELGLFPSKEFEGVTGQTQEAPRKVSYATNTAKLLFGFSDDVRITEAMLLSRFDLLKETVQEFEGKTPNAQKAQLTEAAQVVSKRFGEERVAQYSPKELINEAAIIKAGKLFKEIEIPLGPGSKLYTQLQSTYDVPVSKQEPYFEARINKQTYSYSDKAVESPVLTVSAQEGLDVSQLEIRKDLGFKDVKQPQLLASGTFKPLVTNAAGDFIINPELSERGGAGFYYQPPKVPGGPGIVGLSYVLGGSESEAISLFPKTAESKILVVRSVLDTSNLELAKNLLNEGKGINEVQRILNQRAPFGSIGATAKLAAGVESEFAQSSGGLEFTGREKIIYLEERPVRILDTRRITNPVKLAEIKELYQDYNSAANKLQREEISQRIKQTTGISPEDFAEPKTKYVAASELISPLLSRKTNIYSEERITSKSGRTVNITEASLIRSRQRERQVIREENIIPKEKYTSSYGQENFSYSTEPPVETISYNYNYFPQKGSGGNYSPPVIPEETNFRIVALASGERKRRQIRSLPTYNVFIRRRGKYVPIRTDVLKGEALKFGAEQSFRELARTFKVRATGRTVDTFGDVDFMPEERQFRNYQVRAGKKIPLSDTYIQKSSANLQTREEKALIAAAKRSKKQRNSFY